MASTLEQFAMNVSLLRQRSPETAIKIVDLIDDWKRLGPGRYEFTRILKLSNGTEMSRVMSCGNPVYAKHHMDEAGLVMGAPV